MERALVRALADWRLLPSEELADHVDLLSDALTRLRPPLSPEQIRAAAHTPSPVDLGPVLASLPAITDPALPELLDLLFRWPRDPRVATALHRLLCQAVPQARASSLWNRLLALVAWSNDRRACRWLLDFSTQLDGTPWQVLRVGARIQQLAGDLERTHPLSRGPLKVCPRPRPMPVEPAPIREVPDGLEAKLVWADELSARGDVRGEAIVLGLMPSPRRQQRRRVRQLERQYGRAWLGRLSPAFKPEGLKFRHGAVVAGRLSVSRLLPRLQGLPEWSTVEELDLREAVRWPGADWRALAQLLADPAMKRLRRLVGLPYSALHALLKQHRRLAVEHCELGDPWYPSRSSLWLGDLARSPVFHRLKTLRVGHELHQIEPLRNPLA